MPNDVLIGPHFLDVFKASKQIQPVSVGSHLKPLRVDELCGEVKKAVSVKFLLFHVIRVTAKARPSENL